ncbi:MAG TPA: FHA domain-containing serine/threonine-protein kinase [Pyrinomonadaceae bacterium]|jgi:pSer/pThr/pTyr-binding forkhead associated (FHA) protein|nr:FHA domain-containing serine/threonine-protein kinase [Pyrinomonadaceae bacterium]
MRVTLKVLEGPYAGRDFTFDQHDTFLIGRGDNAHLYLPEDKFFSRHHCLIEIAPPRVFLRDLGSTNGTFVNNQRVTEAFLSSGDRIQGGATVLQVEVQAEQPVTMDNSEAPTLSRPTLVQVECANCGRREQTEAAPDAKLTFICEECREELKRRPQPVPGYEMIRVLGRGGMGCVMLARDEKNGNSVAIKTLLPEVAVADQSLKRFMREIEVAAALDHPNIVRFLESGTHNGAVYLVSEYVEGSDAAKLADSQGGRLPYRQAIDIISQSLDALAYAHRLGYIHRDIKESNILITGGEPTLTAKLTDFGLAKSFTQSGMSGITMAGDMAGTFAYMPPEQIRDFRNVRPTSDIYAIGMTAYSLLAGDIALNLGPGHDMAGTVRAIFEGRIIPLRDRAPDVPERVAEVIERALAKEPDQRWQSATAMRTALMHVA